jgi:hypothetical protein
MLNQIKILDAEKKNVNINSIVKIHQKCLPNNILTNLGKSFLIRMYCTILNNKYNTLIIARYKKKIIGFIVLNFFKENFIKYVKISNLLIFFKNITINPSLLLSLYYQLIHNKNYPNFNSCEISHFAVSQKYRGIGVGKKLIFKSIKIAISKNLSFIRTKTKYVNLSKFYINTFNASIIEKFCFLDKIFFIIKIPIKSKKN